MRHIFALAALFTAVALFGCSTQQPDQTQAEPQTASAPQSQSQLVIAPQVIDQPAHPLPFKGRCSRGRPYRTSARGRDVSVELFAGDVHLSRRIDPRRLSRPAGCHCSRSRHPDRRSARRYRVRRLCVACRSATATLLGDYTAKEHVSKSYSLYTNASHKELEDAALAAVRQRIDQKLYDDEARLAQARRQCRQISRPLPPANDSSASGNFLLRREHRRHDDSDAPWRDGRLKKSPPPPPTP